MKKNILILFFFTFSLAHSQIKSYSLPESDKVEGTIIRIDSFPTKLIQPRNVDVWLPKNYSKDKKYNVLYMHDGQNLFDANTTWNKEEWKVDEVASKLIIENKITEFIVVGIHNIPQIRFLDLFPKKALNFIAEKDKEYIFDLAKKRGVTISENDFKGDDYLKFIVEEVKPYIDETYSTLKNQENTFVGGSSMGGLMSMYAICEYPEIFVGAICISTHWPGLLPNDDQTIPNSFFSYLEKNIPNYKNHKFYFDFGTESLDRFYPQYEETVNKLFKEKNYTSVNYKNLKFEGENHSEVSWQKRLDIPFEFMFKK
ncbi:alpha/beta hydrolase-fold protein [Flavobacterium gelidilacus]|jgi:predicted alpha/beta superfamily hydrolase|uniref:alpha/beta hydrolase n=1 Tax=Flavobacterium gelidilacus TaxID=206041 RepID=UPI00041B4A24|nr:alpha/beta hydrolase-fold protein [Flavobacterium gelidilacus]